MRLHERVLYEQVREKVLAGALETQRLLVPEPVDLSSGRNGRGTGRIANCWRNWESKSNRSAAERC